MNALTFGTLKEPGEASGIGASFCICILHYPPKFKITTTLLEDSPIGATSDEYK
jgi:hypothetical protein